MKRKKQLRLDKKRKKRQRPIKLKESVDYILHPEKASQWEEMSKDERSLYRRYRKGANNRGKEFNIGLLYFCQLISSKCFYCGIKPFQTHNKLKYMGVDRIKNDKGYIYGNVISCCKTCNFAKGSMDDEEFHSWIHQISEEYSLRKRKVEELTDVEYFQSRGFSVNADICQTNKIRHARHMKSVHTTVDVDYMDTLTEMLSVNKTY